MTLEPTDDPAPVHDAGARTPSAGDVAGSCSATTAARSTLNMSGYPFERQ